MEESKKKEWKVEGMGLGYTVEKHKLGRVRVTIKLVS